MSLKMTKAPFAIAAIAAAITFTSASFAKANTLVVQAPFVATDTAQVSEVGFKIKKSRGFKHRGFKRHRSFQHRGFRHNRGFRHRGFVHHPKASRSRIILRKRF